MNLQDFATENEKINQARSEALQERAGELKHKNEFSQVLGTVNTVGARIVSAIDKKTNDVNVTNFPTSVSTPDVDKLLPKLEALIEKTDPEDAKSHELLTALLDAVNELPREFPEAPEGIEEVTVKNQKDYDAKFDAVIEAVSNIKTEFKPDITVKPADVKVEKVDFTKLENKIDILTTAVQAISLIVPEKDDTELLKRISATTKAINSLSFPVPNFILPFKSTTGEAVQAQLTADGKLMVDAQITTGGFSPDANLTGSITTVGAVTTITKTDGVKTFTKIIDETNPVDIQTSEVWT